MAKLGRPLGRSPAGPRLEKHIKVDETTDCWVWQGGKNNIGYGMIRDGDKMRTCHRVAYEHYKGPIPDDKVVCHTCDNTLCVNPNHLWLGTLKDNMQDMIAKGRKRTMKDRRYEKYQCPNCERMISSYRLNMHQRAKHKN